MINNFDVVIIGGGPGGYVAAIRLAQLGKNVALIEKRSTLGGTCLNVGCIPSKALLDSSEHYWNTKHNLEIHGVEVSDVKLNLKQLMARKNKVVDEITQGVAYLMKKNKITVFNGIGSFTTVNEILITKEDKTTETIKADKVIIASGSTPIELPTIKIDGKNIITSDHAIHLDKVPKKLIVIGAGVIGLELGSVWKRLGSEVTIVEFADGIMGSADKQIARYTQNILEKQGLQFLFEHKVIEATSTQDSVKVVVETKNGERKTLEGDKLLVAIGRRPVTENLNLDKVGIKLTPRKRIEINSHTFQTNITSIYAIGDVIEGPMLAHKASEEAIAVAEIIVKGHGHMNYDAIPYIIYTWPEVAWVGLGEEELKAKGIEYNVGKSIFRSNGRAKAMNEADGQVKILSDKRTDKILGLYIVGPRASDMIAEAVIAMEFGASSEDIARSVHAHPTLPEIIKEAAMDTAKWAIHS